MDYRSGWIKTLFTRVDLDQRTHSYSLTSICNSLTISHIRMTAADNFWKQCDNRRKYSQIHSIIVLSFIETFRSFAFMFLVIFCRFSVLLVMVKKIIQYPRLNGSQSTLITLRKCIGWSSFTLVYISPFPLWRRILTPLQQTTFENVVTKGEIAQNKQFRLLTTLF